MTYEKHLILHIKSKTKQRSIHYVVFYFVMIFILLVSYNGKFINNKRISLHKFTNYLFHVVALTFYKRMKINLTI